MMSANSQIINKEIKPNLGAMIQKLANQAAQTIGVEAEELMTYLQERKLGDTQSLISIFRLIHEHHLDPMLNHIDQIEDVKDQMATKKLYVTLNGCIKIMNSHPHFQGVEFNTCINTDQEASAWIECVIHRSDRIKPTIVREYMCEANSDSDAWQKMPLRMLRNRALAQCVRIAFGVNLIEVDHIPRKENTQRTEGKRGSANGAPEYQDKLFGAKELKIRLKDNHQQTITA